jgi:hypothetical protein
MRALQSLAFSAMVALGGLVFVAPVSLTAGGGGSSSSEIRIQTRLAGGALNGVTPSGSARFRARSGRTDFSVEVEDVNLPDGTVLKVKVGAADAGSITLKLRGGEFEANSNDGDIVPQAKAGDTVTVSGPDGAIVSGVLR